jgi:uncharacterized protein DUF2800
MDNKRLGLPHASGARRYELCSGSFALGQEAERLGQVSFQTSAEAESGNRQHGWIAGESDIKLSESEETNARLLKERGNDEVERLFGDEAIIELIEHRLYLELGGEKVASGRADRIILNQAKTKGLIQDYKTGFHPVDAAEVNSQLKWMAVMLALEHDTLIEVYGQIISGPHGTSEVRYDLADLGVAYTQVMRTLEAINAPNAPLNPSPEACHFCKAFAICPAVRAIVKPFVQINPVMLPDGGHDAVKLLDECVLLSDLIEQIRDYYAQRLTEDPGYNLPGYQMVPGAQVREIRDWNAALAKLMEYLDPKDLTSSADYKLGGLEKALAKKLNLRLKDAHGRLNDILGDLVVYTPNKPSLRRVSGKPKVQSLIKGERA